MSLEPEHADIKIGTSGWSYDDWVGPFYPEELRRRKSDWLAYYGKHFYTTEINSTFYRMPSPNMVERWINVGNKLNGFEFSVKLPQAVTHEALVEGRDDEAQNTARDFEDIVLEPLAENNLCGAVLIQLSPFFTRFNKKTNEDNLERLEQLFRSFSYDKYMYVAEFRHSSWLNQNQEDLADDTLKLLNSNNIGLCKTDGPGFPKTRSDTAPFGYFRFHGRNSDIWFKGKKFEEEKKSGVSTDKRLNRYDYSYSEDELKYWVPMVKKSVAGKKSGKSRIFFNNHPHGQAVQNAFMMMDLMGLPRKLKDVKLQKQFKIDSF